MFENLRDAFSSAAKSFSEKELKEKDIEDILFQLEISLLESDVASEVIDSIKSDLKEKLIGTKVNKKEIEKFVKDSLIQSISTLFDNAGKIDLFSNIDSKKQTGQPYLILFVGINGTGKTTTLAKLAYLLQKSKYSIVVAAADTFRAGAIEQLKEHTNRLNLKLVAQNYGSDPAAVSRDAVLYAKSHKIDCVLIDTAGRMQTSKNLMDQIEKITNVVKPDFKIFVGDSLAGNDTVNQAKEFHEHTKFDAAILTKSDADARGGAALSIVKITSTPVLYVGVGQEYPDLKVFDKELFLENVFGKVQTNQISFAEKKEENPIPIHESSELKHEKISEIDVPTTEVESPKVIEEQISESKQNILEDLDPFEGIDTNDINKFVDLYDEPPPGNDQQAKQLSAKIKKWISDGRPKPN
jgi:fused signal recognition particle receptor